MIEDLPEAERQIREVVREAGLSWILDGIDEVIAAGVPEDVPIIERNRSKSTDEDDGLPEVYEWRPDSPRKATRTVARSRPMTDRERLELHFAALHRYLIDVPAVHDGVVREINADVKGRRNDQFITTIRFEPELDVDPDWDSDSDPEPVLTVQANEPQPNPERTALRSRAERLLQELREEA